MMMMMMMMGQREDERGREKERVKSGGRERDKGETWLAVRAIMTGWAGSRER